MYDKGNIFAQMIRGEIPFDKVYEDDRVLAFNDLYPAAPTHILVIPKGEYVSFADFAEKASAEEIKYFFDKVREIAIDSGIDEEGYRLITNKGEFASQTVKHFHIHLLGGRPLGGLLKSDQLDR